MGIATNTVAGDVILIGDLTGTATSPQLAPTGVEAGTYPATHTVIDAKGRILYADAGEEVDLEGLVQLATTTNRGLVQPGTNVSHSGVDPFIIFVPDATTSVKGVLRLDGSQGLQATAGLISAKEATTVQKGVVSVNVTGYLTIDGSSVVDLIWPLAFPDATTGSRGVVQVGNNINVSGALISVNIGTAAVKGLLQVGSNLQVSGAVVSVQDGSLTDKGVVQVGTNIDVTGGIISLADATNATKGVFRAGSGFAIVANELEVVISEAIVLSSFFATTSSKGIVQIGSNINVASGVISVPLGSGGSTFGVIKSGDTSVIITDGVLSLDDVFLRTNLEYTHTFPQHEAVEFGTYNATSPYEGTHIYKYVPTEPGSDRFGVVGDTGIIEQVDVTLPFDSTERWAVGDEVIIIIDNTAALNFCFDPRLRFPASYVVHRSAITGYQTIPLPMTQVSGTTESRIAIVQGTVVSSTPGSELVLCRLLIGF